MKIFGIEHNYRQMPPPMGGDERAACIFTKTDSALVNRGKPFFVPDYTQRCEAQVELAVRISHMGRSISPRFAHRYYDAVTVGVDFTAADILSDLTSRGLPWDMAKGFDGSAVIGEWQPIFTPLAEAGGIDFHLDINGQTVQSGCSTDMLRSIDDIVSQLSNWFTLKTGDIIYTGCPVPGVQVAIDDHLTGYMNGQKVLEFNVK